jgi:hypothetical protein
LSAVPNAELLKLVFVTTKATSKFARVTVDPFVAVSVIVVIVTLTVGYKAVRAALIFVVISAVHAAFAAADRNTTRTDPDGGVD